MEHKLDQILSELKEIKERVNDMWKFNNMDAYRDFPPLIHSRSPLGLNTLGSAVLDKYQGRGLVDAHATEWIKEIEARNFSTPLDVQDFTEKLVYSKFTLSEFDKMKRMIYHEPKHEGQAVNLKIMSMIMGLYLRDKYFDKHPELLELVA